MVRLDNQLSVTCKNKNQKTMHFKFQIKSVAGKPEKEGDVIIRFTGQSEYINVNDILGSELITKQGKQVQKFKTGLDLQAVASNGLIASSEKENYKKQVESFRPFLNDYFGEDELDPTNTFFWKDPENGRLKISTMDMDKFYDTRNAKHALLYFNIMGGGFVDTVAPSKEYAERFRIPFFMETEDEFISEDGDSYMTKAQAFSLLRELSETADNQALLYLGWVLHSDSEGFGSYTYSTPKSELFKMHAEFIEGKLKFKRKRQAPTKFIATAETWKEAKTGRPRIITEAYLKAAQIYSYINSDKDGKLSLPSGLVLGLSVDSGVNILLQPKNTNEYEELRNYIEKKWSE